ncbi:MAG: chemotaxis protein CheX [Caldimicrobium sp.]
MAEKRKNTLNELSEILAEATKEVLESNTGAEIKYAPTLQKINFVSLRPDMGAFLEFTGDYNGLLCMNFSKEAAFELYTQAMRFLGIPEEEIAKDPSSEEVINFLGEMVNQIIGNFRKKIEAKYGLIAKNNQPKAISISHTITMYIDTYLNTSQARKISFRSPSGYPFYAELSLEQTEFIPFKNDEEKSVDDLLKELF